MDRKLVFGSNELELEHIIEETNDEYIISAKIKLPKKSKMIDKCLAHGKSPITQALEKIEKEHNTLLKEGKTEYNLYFDDVKVTKVEY